MHVWFEITVGWMALGGGLLGSILARWVQLAPIWMHRRWADKQQLAPPTPGWSWPWTAFMALSTAALWAACAWTWDGPAALIWAVFGSGLWLLACIDARSGWLPDVFTFGLLGLGLLASITPFHTTDGHEAVWGALWGYGILWTAAWGFRTLTGREGLGGGDPKLLSAIGAWMGWSAVAPVLLVASVMGALVGGLMQAYGRWPRNTPFAFGPFMAAAVPLVGLWAHSPFGVFLAG
jgi:leader peptidase (prepilin peptidase) / N-methyltransferase